MSTTENNWINKANCKDEDINIFFPLRYTSTTVSYAFKCCQDCKVKEQCLYEAMTTESYGIWSSTTEQQRSNLLRRFFDGKVRNITIDGIKKIIDNNYYSTSIPFIPKSKY